MRSLRKKGPVDFYIPWQWEVLRYLITNRYINNYILPKLRLIKDIAERESCIFVGRCADYVLRDMPEVLSVFVHASMSDCVKRIQMTTNITRQEVELLIMRTNKTRSEYYRHFTDKTWGNSKNYHLSIDSSDLTADGAADLIMEHLKIREKYQNR